MRPSVGDVEDEVILPSKKNKEEHKKVEITLKSPSKEDKKVSSLMIRSKRRSKRKLFSEKNKEEDENVEESLGSSSGEDDTDSNLLIKSKRRSKRNHFSDFDLSLTSGVVYKHHTS